MNQKLTALRDKMIAYHMDAYLIPTSDAHQSEYLAEHDKTRAYMSGFTGSAGTLLVTLDHAYLWTDGRYFLQAERELKDSDIELCRMGVKGVPSVNEFIGKELVGKTLGFNGKIMAVSLRNAILEHGKDIHLVSNLDLVSEIWENRPEPRRRGTFLMPESKSGLSAQEKIKTIRTCLKNDNADATVIGALEDVCYLFNIRGDDAECNPVLTSYAVIDQKRAILFADKKQLSSEVLDYLKANGIEQKEYEDIFAHVKELDGTVYLDSNRINVYLDEQITAKKIYGLNYSSSMKAIKTPEELESVRNAMLKDGIALVYFLKWLEENKGKEYTEWEVAMKLLDFRKEREGFIEPSFETIAGYGENGAIVHYDPKEDSAKKIKEKSFLLLDSGGQYIDGTTDITRTIPLGELTDKEKFHYTLVLKSHIQLAMAIFPEGTTGFQLDTIAREPLWRYALDFKHGTGHGVGFVLGVHEGPQSISSAYRPVAMEENMLTSNEPGLYIAGSHGIRIESLIRAKVEEENEFGRFLGFETVTVCPIDTRPIMKEYLLEEEIKWLNGYNQWCYEKLYPHLPEEEQKYLEFLTQSI